MRRTREFWPLDDDDEGEIFENPAWDLPGWNRSRRSARPGLRRRDGSISLELIS